MVQVWALIYKNGNANHQSTPEVRDFFIHLTSNRMLIHFKCRKCRVDRYISVRIMNKYLTYFKLNKIYLNHPTSLAQAFDSLFLPLQGVSVCLSVDLNARHPCLSKGDTCGRVMAAVES